MKPYRCQGNRISLLPITYYCPLAGRLGEQYGAGRSAAVSTAFHAWCAGDPEALSALDEGEREEVRKWKRPADVIVEGTGVLLEYDTAEVERRVGLTKDGRFCAADDSQAITAGTLDFAWVREVNGHRVAFVGDIKRQEWTQTDPMSLQLLGYAFAWADLHECSHFCTGLWYATEGEWKWGDLVDLESPEALRMWERVSYAAQNTEGPGVMGSHCGDCYSRLQCPEYLLPPEVASSSLACLTEGGELTEDKALELKLLLDRAKKTTEAAEKTLKEYAKRVGGIRDGKGKIWKAIPVKGRASFDKKSLEKDMGKEFVEKYTKVGAQGTRMSWVNDKGTT